MTSPVDRAAGALVRRVAPDRLGKPLSRRLFLAGATAGAAALGLTACGGNSPTEAAPTPGSAEFPVTLVGKEGTAMIPAEPQRVIALGWLRDTDTALALGVTPIAVAENSVFPSGVAPWVEAKLTDQRPELISTTDGIPFEKIAGLRPDLILATDSYELTGNYSRLAQIAPTVSYVDGVESDTWQQRTTVIGMALGRDEQAKKIISDIDAQLRQAAQANPTFSGKTFSRYYAHNGEIRAITEQDAGVKIIEQLGLTLSPEITALPETDTPGRAAVSLENLGVLDADVMLVSYPTEDDQAFLESSPLFQQLNAVKNGTYIRLDQPTSMSLSFPSVLSIPYGLDRTVTAVASALK